MNRAKKAHTEKTAKPLQGWVNAERDRVKSNIEAYNELMLSLKRRLVKTQKRNADIWSGFQIPAAKKQRLKEVKSREVINAEPAPFIINSV